MRRRLMLKSSTGVSPVLPAEYQEVEWVGVVNTTTVPTAYLQAGRVIEPDDVLHIDMKPFSIIDQYDSPFGYVSSTLPGWELYYSNNGNQIILYARSTTARLLNYNIGTDWDNVEIEFYINNGLTILIYRDNNYAFSGKVKTVYIENSGIVKHNYIPCYRKSDGEIGMYDIVTNTFLSNAGTGTLVKGADV